MRIVGQPREARERQTDRGALLEEHQHIRALHCIQYESSLRTFVVFAELDKVRPHHGEDTLKEKG